MKFFKSTATVFLSILSFTALAQPGYWQNHVDYKMDIQMDVSTHRFAGEQWLTFSNNSPDTITEVFYHLYFNAFQPESMMDTRSRNIADPDGRVGDRISKLNANEVGYHEVYLLEQDGQVVEFDVTQTVMKVKLKRAIVPGDATVLHMKFNSQVPVQIRRSGRDNRENVAYSMSQWYPKLAMYDADGWHPDPYVAREFYGEFGRFVVNITIDRNFTVGGTGVLTNPQEVGNGYVPQIQQNRQNDKITYKFVAENVHDFAWAADDQYTHDIVQVEGGPEVHFLYKESTANVENWKLLEETVPAYFQFMANHFGLYQYPQFTVAQAGDGGMEYPMATFVLGGGEEWEGFLGLFVHEATHNWYYGMLGTNEAMYPWMDEGFTTFAEDEAMKFLLKKDPSYNPHARVYQVYNAYQNSPLREPVSTPGDHFDYNQAYSISSYYLGSIFLNQLRGIVGDDHFERGMMQYFDMWHFKHPKPEDFIRVMERESGLILDWYLNYWINMQKPIDYAIDTVLPMGGGATQIRLENMGTMPMPVDVKITTVEGQEIRINIPLVMMFGHKPAEVVEQPWPWTHPTYTFQVGIAIEDIQSIELNPDKTVADINVKNDRWSSGK